MEMKDKGLMFSQTDVRCKINVLFLVLNPKTRYFPADAFGPEN